MKRHVASKVLIMLLRRRRFLMPSRGPLVQESPVHGPIPEGLSERLYAVLVLALVLALIVWLNLPGLLWPAFIVALILVSVDRWRRGVYPWPPRKRRN